MIVRVLYREEPDGWWAESPDVQGWSVAGATFDEVRALAEDGIRFALDAESVEMEHFVAVDRIVTAFPQRNPPRARAGDPG